MAEGKRQFRFKATQKSPTLEIGHGEYRRKFVAAEQPFEVESDDEAQILKGTGLFVELKGSEMAAAAEEDAEPSAIATGSRKRAKNAGETPAVPVEE